MGDAPDAGRLPGFVIDDRTVAVHPLVPSRSFDEALSYALPGEFVETVRVGSIVEIPLGTSMRVGVVAALDVDVPGHVRLRPIARVIDQPTVPSDLVRLAEWLSDQYACARTVALSLVVGPSLAGQAKAAAVPHRRRQLAVRRVVDDVGGIELTSRQRAIAARVPRGWVAVASACEQLGTTRATIGKLAEAGIVRVDERFLDELETLDAPLPQDASDTVAGARGGADSAAAIAHTGGSFVTLSAEQLAAVDACTGRTSNDDADPATLLVGVTGSGKTEVYLESIAHVLDAGGDAIVLVPEIALTPQTAARFQRRFTGQVEVLHSAMTKAQRTAAHARIARGEARVVVGARSAVFAPVRNLGIIVIDEEHDSSYKQDSEPRYDARRVAFRRALETGARIILGSATPRPESWAGVRRHVVLRERPGGGRLAPVELVDIREHEDDFPLTTPVCDAISATLQRGRKVIVLHNRRGYAQAMHCRTCGTTFRCDRCDVSLVVHGRVARRQRLSCHHCGRDEPVPTVCGVCGSTDVARLGAGTEQLELLLEQRFDVPVLRLDADAVRTRGAVHEILDSFRDAGPAMLVGTQMVAKGHDFPDVELAVVIDADTALAIPDFRAEERAFALVAQLAGRAGRSAQSAEHARVLVQTRTPDLELLRDAVEHNTQRFVEREIAERTRHGWPPACRIVRVLVSARSPQVRDRWAAAVRDGLDRLAAGEVLGPAPLMRINDRERAQVLITTQRAAAVAQAMRRFLARSEPDRRRADVRVVVDVDPQALL